MGLLIGFLLRWILGAALFYGAIRVVDGHNQNNTLPAAMGWCLVMACAGIFPLVGLIVGLIVFVMICTRYYELSCLQTIGVVIMEVVLAVGVGFVLGALGLAKQQGMG